MLRLSRNPSSRRLWLLSLSCSLALPALLTRFSHGQEAPAATSPSEGAATETFVGPAAPSTITPQEKQLRDDVAGYFHYCWVGRYDVATGYAQKILDETQDAKQLIPILESSAHQHDANMTYIAQLNLFRSQKDVQEVTDKLLAKVNEGVNARANDISIISQTIRDMSLNERAYQNHLVNLRKSGELAVPIIFDFLRLEDDDHKPYRDTARRALTDLGRLAVNPLLAATRTRQSELLMTAVSSLGEIGYAEAEPFLTLVANDPSQIPSVRNAATTALGRLHLRTTTARDPAQMFYDLAERFYYNNSEIAQIIQVVKDDPTRPMEMSNYWSWNEQTTTLSAQQVPASIFGDLMAMRCAEQALAIRGDLSPAVALWIAADNKREAELPAGQNDPVNKDQRPAHFYNVSVGATHLGEALTRAQKDQNIAVELKLTRSLGQIIGRSSMDNAAARPLTQSLTAGSRQVRFEAACALGATLPEKAFANQEQVVPLLIEAVGSSGKGNVIVIGKDQDDANALQAEIVKLGFSTVAAPSVREAITQSTQLPGVDAVIVSRNVSDDDVRQLVGTAGHSPRLAQAPEIVLREKATGSLADQMLGNNMLSIATAAQGDALAAAIADSRKKVGDLAMSDEDAAAYAMRAAMALDDIAIHQSGVLKLQQVEVSLTPALASPNADLSMVVGRILSHLTTEAAQRGLATRALDPQTPAPVKVSLYRSLASSAKNHGNQLDGQQVKQLGVEIDGAKDEDVRSAAAEARGALNLPIDQARKLILDQVR